ncbi:hypothetical protein ARC20_03910 [Stenotrophomonas panacihumi]|uniref:DUF2894 domain-containing protein n=1 Tax=Stenotrophomonas panacihumi TaxID=676599 RepID=A0A0R0ANK8_9GAMM|nr:DUF2894 domain-containing protein [Stenotrophomonas panacihumi]KRG46828.1 hypothetical protein ARC20_03910 [Stenotrophomonas panacihumi]
MHTEHDATQARLAQWREVGADGFDPPRFRFIEAMALRVSRHEGVARDALQARVAVLMDAYASDLAQADSRTGDARAHASVGGPLAPLLGRMAAARRAQGTDDAEGLPQLPALNEFRQLWGELLGERRLRQSLAPQPEDAGPLNSGVLVHRAMAHMRASSPEYLRHFLAYADHLCWLERLYQARTPATATPSSPGRRAAPRKRRS